jgi:dTDP-4-dehydrorhamnose reductase
MTAETKPLLLILGAGGQVGGELVRALASLGTVRPMDRASLDLCDTDAIRAAIDECAPTVIVNAAAYTHVDRAETERELAWRVNGEAPGLLGAEAARRGALLVHYSTDYVFDGTGSHAYSERDAPQPQTFYGASKLRGDEAVLESGADAFIFRVGWVYSGGEGNFLSTMLRLARVQRELRVVGDQHGGPTWSRAIATATALAVSRWLESPARGGVRPARGVYHMAPPDHTTRRGFASAIVEMMTMSAGAARSKVISITSKEYPTLAKRPAWSVLDATKLRETFGLELPPWREQLAECLNDLAR